MLTYVWKRSHKIASSLPLTFLGYGFQGNLGIPFLLLLEFIRSFKFSIRLHLKSLGETLINENSMQNSTKFHGEFFELAILEPFTTVFLLQIITWTWNHFYWSWKLKQNPTSDFQCCTTLIQRQNPTLKQR